MIDSLEQNEEDPRRLSNLFAMDHLVTRMRRNSENLLLLAGHEGARKWSEPVPLTDVARAAISEIEQYNRVSLKIQPGVMIPGPAMSDIAHAAGRGGRRGADTSGTRPAGILSADGPARFRPRRSTSAGGPVSS
jgi:hypothetical protein